MNSVKRLLLLLILILLPSFLLGNIALGEEAVPAYADYLEKWQDKAPAQNTIYIQGAQYHSLHNSGAYVEPGETQGIKDALIWASGFDQVSYNFTIQEDGLYEIHLTYLPLKARQMELEFSLMIDGIYPFDKAQNITLQRMYEPQGSIVRDTRGNDIRPKLQEVEAWQTVALTDVDGYYTRSYQIYLTKGEHQLTFSMIAEAMAISSISLTKPVDAPSYEDYIAAFSPQESKAVSSITIQAENFSRCSSQVIYPLSERANAATQPSDPVKTRMNTVGGDNWKEQGQWVEWNFTVNEEGLYHLTMQGLQEFSRGMSSVRQLTLDGQPLFNEAMEVAVPFKVNW